MCFFGRHFHRARRFKGSVYMLLVKLGGMLTDYGWGETRTGMCKTIYGPFVHSELAAMLEFVQAR